MAEHLVVDAASFHTAFTTVATGDTIRLLKSVDLPNDQHSYSLRVSNITIVGGHSLPTAGVEPRPEIRSIVKDWAAPDKAALMAFKNAKDVKFLNVKLDGGYNSNAILAPGRQRGGVIVGDQSEIEFCNCTLSGWPFFGIRVNENAAARVMNCDIRNCRQDGLGYGVAVYGGFAEVAYCVFQSCRHMIAARGDETGSYLAHDNYMLMTDPHHAIDVHGSSDLPAYDSYTNFPGTRHDRISTDYDPTQCGGVAGRRFVIERNVVINNSGAPEEAVVIRGQPIEYCSITDNVISRCTIKIPRHADKRRFYVYGNRRDDSLS